MLYLTNWSYASQIKPYLLEWARSAPVENYRKAVAMTKKSEEQKNVGLDTNERKAVKGGRPLRKAFPPPGHEKVGPGYKPNAPVPILEEESREECWLPPK